MLPFGVAAATLWLLPAAEEQQVVAGGGSILADTDEDFLPDVVEWAVMTNSANGDTDDDGTSDFVEVVQGGAPRYADDPMALDHAMRVVMTGPAPGSADQTSWLHVLLRFATNPTPVTSFSVWFEPPWAPGLKLPLESLFAGAVLAERETPHEGTWMCASVPLVSAGLLQTLLPCGIYGEAVIDGQLHRTGVTLLELQAEIVTIVPYGPRHSGRFAFQTIAPPLAVLPSSNRVCVIDLREVGSGPGGTVFEVAAADCEDCNDLECGPACPESVGWVLTIPGGMSALGDG